MKTKNANFIQAHVEKLVLAAALLLALLFTLIFAVRSPNKVELEPNQALAPGEVEAFVAQRAVQLKSRLDRNESLGDQDPQFADGLEVPTFVQDFEVRHVAADRFLATLPLSSSAPGPDLTPPAAPLYAVPTPPVVTDMVVVYNQGVLGGYDELAMDQAYSELIQAETGQPRDVRGVTVKAMFSMESWIARLSSTRLPSGTVALPPTYRRQAERIASVSLVRQVLDPATGEWGEVEPVALLPDQLGYSPYFPFPDDEMTSSQRLQTVNTQQELILQPNTPLMEIGAWRLPDADAPQLTEADHAEVRELLDDIESLDERIETLLPRIEQALLLVERDRGRQGGNQPRQQNNFGGGFGEEDFEGGFDAGRGNRQPAQAAGGTAAERQLAQLQSQLNQLLQDRQAKVQEILLIVPESMFDTPVTDRRRPAAGGGGFNGEFDESGFEEDFDSGFQPRQTRPAGNTPAALASGEVEVWATDLTAQPGMTYRYKVVVAPVNPLYNQTRVSSEQREQYQGRMALAPSALELDSLPWSEPVTIDRESYFFLIDGSSRNGTANFELWRYFNGEWHSGPLEDVSPGSMIAGSVRTEVDDRPMSLGVQTEALLVDVVPGLGGRRSSVGALFVDPQSQALVSRDNEQDSAHTVRTRLRNMTELFGPNSVIFNDPTEARRDPRLGG